MLVLGESGTGKEMFAHAIHDLSVRRAGPFVAFNFGAMSEELTISEMCGHEPGAFTGATASGTKSGIFDSAQGGTLFIDELQDAGPKAQSLLLRFVETHTFVRVGGTAPVQSDVRVIAASNNADARLAERVRPDLLYRLNSITVRIPPLRERLEDIQPIAERHLRPWVSRNGRSRSMGAVEALSMAGQRPRTSECSAARDPELLGDAADRGRLPADGE